MGFGFGKIKKAFKPSNFYNPIDNAKTSFELAKDGFGASKDVAGSKFGKASLSGGASLVGNTGRGLLSKTPEAGTFRRLSPGVYMDAAGQTIRSAQAPGQMERPLAEMVGQSIDPGHLRPAMPTDLTGQWNHQGPGYEQWNIDAGRIPQQQAPAQPNQFGMTRLSPGVYRDASGNISHSSRPAQPNWTRMVGNQMGKAVAAYANGMPRTEESPAELARHAAARFGYKGK